LWEAMEEQLKYSGRFDHTIDNKGRVMIPRTFRDVLAKDGHESLFVTNFFSRGEPCLELLPPSNWENLLRSVRERGGFDPDMQDFERFYIGNAFEVPVDRQGRLLIPETLRNHAHLEHQVVFSVRRSHFQLWDKEIYDRIFQLTLEKVRDPQFYAKLNIPGF
jgi:MraZ protein